MRTHERVGVTICLLIVSAAAVVVLSPGDSTESSALAVESSDASSPGTAGLRAYLDPETGELAAGIEPSGAITLDPETQNALRYDDEGLVLVRHASGSVSMSLEQRYQNASIARIDENGKVIVCTDNVASVERSLNGQISTPAPLEVK